MILLTPDERKKIQQAWFNTPLNKRIDPEVLIAQAQLKKVAEWLDTLEFYNDWGGEQASLLRDHIKRAILKEVESTSTANE